MALLQYILDRVRLREEQMSVRYDELQSGLNYLIQDSLAVFRVDLTWTGSRPGTGSSTTATGPPRPSPA